MKKIDSPFGYVIDIGKTCEVGCAVLVIEPGKKIGPEYHKRTKEIEYIISGEVICLGKLLKEGAINIWEPGQVHEYINKSNSPVKILCITIPPFDPTDVFEGIK